MRIIVNGEPKEIPGPMSVAELVAYLGLKSGRVAVELNREIVPRDRQAEARVEAGAVLEIVQAVGGG
jgi:thiamine biosynthesis protein ThiS